MSGAVEFPSIDLRDRVVIVTGASSGIGAATARALHGAGARPVLAARRRDRLEALAAELTDSGEPALAVAVDVTDPTQVTRLVHATLERHGRVDGLVNNAGATLGGTVAELDLDGFTRAVELNVTSLLRVTQAVLPAMRAAGSGRIVNVSSGTTRMTPTGVGGYAATKSAVNMLSAVARAELAGDGIAVSLICPSITGTEFGGGMFTAGVEYRPGVVAHTPDYVAGFILRLLRTGEAEVDVPHGPEQPGLFTDDLTDDRPGPAPR